MEFKQYLEIIKKNMVFVTVFTLGGLALALISTKNLSKNYIQNQTFFVASQATPTATLQQSTTYYMEEEARNFTDTTVALIQSPDFQNDLAQKGSISIKKNGPQVITITASTKTPQEAKILLKGTVLSFNNKLASLNNQQTILKEVGTPSAPSQRILSKKVAATAGLFLGLAASILAISLKTYFKL